MIGGEAAGRNHTMQMGMMLEFLTPGMEHAEEADFGAEMAGIARHFEQRFGTGAEQEIVDDLLVLQGQRGEPPRKGEDDMDVGGGQEFAAARSQPTVASGGLTLGTVSIPAGIERDGHDTRSGTHRSRCPPRAAVRQRSMAANTLRCWPVIQRRLASMNCCPATRMRSATSSGGRLIYLSPGGSSFFPVVASAKASSGLAVALRWRWERCK